MNSDDNKPSINPLTPQFSLYTKSRQGLGVIVPDFRQSNYLNRENDVMIIDVGRTHWNISQLLAFHQTQK